MWWKSLIKGETDAGGSFSNRTFDKIWCQTLTNGVFCQFNWWGSCEKQMKKDRFFLRAAPSRVAGCCSFSAAAHLDYFLRSCWQPDWQLLVWCVNKRRAGQLQRANSSFIKSSKNSKRSSSSGRDERRDSDGFFGGKLHFFLRFTKGVWPWRPVCSWLRDRHILINCSISQRNVIFANWMDSPSISGIAVSQGGAAGAASVLEGLEEFPKEASALWQNEDIKMWNIDVAFWRNQLFSWCGDF